MRKILLTIIISIFLISFTTAAISNLGTFKVNTCIELPQTSPDATYNNISKITTDNELTIVSGEVEMTKVGTYFNYTFCNTTLLGEYIVNGYGDEGGTLDTWEYTFDITTSGNAVPTSGESILYFVFVAILFGILLVMIYFICALPSENIKDEETGTIMGIVKLKYLRIVLIAISYPMVIIILNLLNGLAYNFTSLSIFSGVLGFLFEVLLRGAWIFTLIIIIWIFYLLVQDSNFKKMLKKMGRPF